VGQIAASALTSLAGAQAHIDDLIEFFESRHEGLSENDSLKHIQHLNDMCTHEGASRMRERCV
jgi:hypothetical protein